MLPRVRPPLRPRLLALALLGLSGTGCFRVTFVDHVAEAKQPPGTQVPEQSFWQHNVVYGLVNLSHDVDVRDVCGAPPERVQTAGDVLTSALTLVTAGLYFPRKIYVTCPARHTPRPPERRQ